MTKKLYFCNSCRKKIGKIEELLFVEESKRGFCSEDCIVDFFSPYMKHFDYEEQDRRLELDIVSEEISIALYQDKSLFEMALYSPSEVWSERNDLGEEFFTHIHSIDDELSYILICSYYESDPSFVFFKTLTKSKALIHKYQREHRVVSEDESSIDKKDKNSLDDISLPAEVIEGVDLKKSEYLAKLLINRKESDISIEQYPIYDDYITLTLNDPDDEFHSEDDAGDSIYTFVKSFKKSGQDFFYIVICLNVDIPNSSDTALLPVITFPSIDEELYRLYAVGLKKKNRVTS